MTAIANYKTAPKWREFLFVNDSQEEEQRMKLLADEEEERIREMERLVRVLDIIGTKLMETLSFTTEGEWRMGLLATV